MANIMSCEWPRLAPFILKSSELCKHKIMRFLFILQHLHQDQFCHLRVLCTVFHFINRQDGSLTAIIINSRRMGNTQPQCLLLSILLASFEYLALMIHVCHHSRPITSSNAIAPCAIASPAAAPIPSMPLFGAPFSTSTSPHCAAAVVGRLSPLAYKVLQIVGSGPVTYCVAVVVVVTVYAGPIRPVTVVPDSATGMSY